MVWPFSSSGQAQPGPSSPDSSSTAAASPTDFTQPQGQGDASSSSSFSSSSPSSSGTSYFNTAQFSQPSSSSSPYDPSYTPTAAGLFSSPEFDAARLHPLAGLGKDDVEYLDIVDTQPNTIEGARTALPSRGWSDDLCYGTGTTYLSGLAIGGLLGAREGLTRPLGVDSPTLRLRINAMLNQVTRRGSFMGNSAGVIALLYNAIDAIIDNARGKHDIAGAMAAGGLSGAIFKATAGVRPMAISSGIMMAAAAGWTTAKKALLEQ